MSPFPEQFRKYWKKAGGDKCNYEIYSEEKGFHECGEANCIHVHHITPESETVETGGNPDNSVGMPVCDRHHVRNSGDEEYSQEFGFHPEMAGAYKNYREWKKRKKHMESITGKKLSKKDFPSPFAEAQQDNRRKAERGERYHNGTPELDGYYEQKMTDKATRMNTLSGKKKPTTRRIRGKKPKPNNFEWSKGVFDE